MTNRSRVISWPAATFIILLLCVGAASPIEVAAERSKPKAQRPKAQQPKRSRYLMFEVTIKGHHEEPLGMRTVVWSIDRSYSSGLIEFKTHGPLLVPGAPQYELDAAMRGDHSDTWLAFEWPLHITIKDSYKQVSTEVCQPKTQPYVETTTLTTNWAADYEELSWSTAGLENVLSKGGNASSKNWYNLYAPILPSTDEKKLLYTQAITIEGGNRQPNPAVVKNLPIGSIEMPIIKGLLDHWAIRHAIPREIDMLLNYVDYDSGDLTLEPGPELMPFATGTRQKVKIRVRYHWSNAPFTSLPEIK